MTESTLRHTLLTTWLNECFKGEPYAITPLAGDASFRRYWRVVTHDTSYVLMDAPPSREPLDSFLKTTDTLARSDINVPNIFFKNIPLGTLLLSDFGDLDYSQVLTTNNADRLYQDAIDSLIRIQRIVDTHHLPVFDKTQIQKELALFDEWYLQKHLNINTDRHVGCYDYLVNAIIEQPKVPIHRDYHSRNLMLTKTGQLGIIDHQDMMLGPVSYDLVSLLRDCYIEWDDTLVNRSIDYFLKQSGVDYTQFKHWFTVTGVQRHLKAIGIFARLHHLYHKPNYLQYIPRALKYIQFAADKNSGLDEIANLTRQIP